MKKIDLGQTVAVLANLGVIAGIAFLAVEISQNTRSLEVGAYQELLAQISRLNELGIENPQAFAVNQGHADSALADLGPEEYQVVSSIALVIIRHGDMAFHQYERGLLTPERLESAMGPLNDNVCRPIYQDIWASFRHNFVESYQQYLDSKIASCL